MTSPQKRPAPGAKGRSLVPVRRRDEQPEEAMSRKDYDLLVSLHQDKSQAALATLQTLSPEQISEMVVAYCSDRQGGLAAVQEDGVAKLGVISTALRLLREKYNLSDADGIRPDRVIVRAEPAAAELESAEVDEQA